MAEQPQGNMDISGAFVNLNNSVTTLTKNLAQSGENMQSLMKIIRGSADEEMYKLQTEIQVLSLKYTDAKNTSDYLCRKTKTTKRHLCLVAQEVIDGNILPTEAIQEYVEEIGELVTLFKDVHNSHQSIIEEIKTLVRTSGQKAVDFDNKSKQPVEPTAEVRGSVLAAVTLDAKGIRGKILAIRCSLSLLTWNALPSNILSEFTKQNNSLAKMFLDLETQLKAVHKNANEAMYDLQNVITALSDIDKKVKTTSDDEKRKTMTKLIFRKCIDDFTRVEEYGEKYSEKTKSSS